MQHTHVLCLLIPLALTVCSCGALRQKPTNNIGYLVIANPESKPTIQIGSNGAMAAGLYGGTLTGATGGNTPLLGLTVGGSANRSMDADVETQLQHDNKNTTGALSRDQSPQDTDQTNTSDRHTTIPISVGDTSSATASDNSTSHKPDTAQAADSASAADTAQAADSASAADTASTGQTLTDATETVGNAVESATDL